MHSGELNHSQLAILRARIAPAISFLRSLHDRMKDKGFAWNDRLRIRVVVALDALEQLNECLVQLSRTRVAQSDYLRGLKDPHWRRQERE